MMKNSNNIQINLLGYACGLGAGIKGCELSIPYLDSNKLLDKLHNKNITAKWHNIFVPNENLSLLDNIYTLNQCLANEVMNLRKNNKFFVTLGGDHTCAIGTWSGVSAFAQSYDQSIGLIWIDAHLDSHTPATSHSHNIHGMPLAVLLGQGHTSLTSIINKKRKLNPHNIVLIGPHDYEDEEYDFLINQGVKIYFLNEINNNFEEVFQEALRIVNYKTSGYGISIDLDGLDALNAPGVGLRTRKGIDTSQLIILLSKYVKDDKKFIGAEICELNPLFDVENRTVQTIITLIDSLVPTSNNY